ncbi:unnamed protein product [Closterium sp. NIES-54]
MPHGASPCSTPGGQACPMYSRQSLARIEFATNLLINLLEILSSSTLYSTRALLQQREPPQPHAQQRTPPHQRAQLRIAATVRAPAAAVAARPSCRSAHCRHRSTHPPLPPQRVPPLQQPTLQCALPRYCAVKTACLYIIRSVPTASSYCHTLPRCPALRTLPCPAPRTAALCAAAPRAAALRAAAPRALLPRAPCCPARPAHPAALLPHALPRCPSAARAAPLPYSPRCPARHCTRHPAALRALLPSTLCCPVCPAALRALRAPLPCCRACCPALLHALPCHCALPCCRAVLSTAALRHATAMSAPALLTYCRIVRSPTEPELPLVPRSASYFLVLKLDLFPVMATITILAVEADGCPLEFDSWLERLHMYLQRFILDGASLFEHTSGSLQPPTTPTELVANTGDEVPRRCWVDRNAYRRWTTRDSVGQLAAHTHLSLTQRAHFRQVTSAQTFYDAVVKHYSSISPATLGHLALPFLLPDLSSLPCGGGGSGGGQQ